MINHIISENDLNSLLADLIENAIIAVQYQKAKNIFVNIGISNAHYIIDIFDSGIPFETDVFLNLGVKQTTTHSHSGGSGIGLMNIYELLQNYSASLIIEEFPPTNKNYTKKISILFNNQNQYIIKTYRKDILETLLPRDDIIILMT